MQKKTFFIKWLKMDVNQQRQMGKKPMENSYKRWANMKEKWKIHENYDNMQTHQKNYSSH